MLIVLLSSSIYLLNKVNKLDRFILAYKETSIALEEKINLKEVYRLYFNVVGRNNFKIIILFLEWDQLIIQRTN